ncbi:MAG: cellulose biosynthesis protein BcsQ [Stenotrophomonas maltophilia]
MSTVLAMYGLRGGTGVSTLLAGLADALHALQQRVLLVDMSPDNLLGLHFNLPFIEPTGWARAQMEGSDWRDAAFAVEDGLTVVPYGRLDLGGISAVEQQLAARPELWSQRIEALSADVDWLLFDLPSHLPAHAASILRHARCDMGLQVVNVDSGSHALLQRPELRDRAQDWLLVNRYDPGRQLQRDLMQLWLHDFDARLVPQPVHEDGSAPEALASKLPIRRHAPASLAAADLDSLAVWCLTRANLDPDEAHG